MPNTLSGNGSFDGSLLNLASYLGNAILPVISGLSLATAIYSYSQRRDGERYLTGAVLALLASGFVRLAESFVGQSTGPDQYYNALIALTNWTGNVILPVYAAVEFIKGVLGLSGFMDRLYIGEDWTRHFIIGTAALSVSGILRLLESFVLNGTGGI